MTTHLEQRAEQLLLDLKESVYNDGWDCQECGYGNSYDEYHGFKNNPEHIFECTLDEDTPWKCPGVSVLLNAAMNMHTEKNKS